MDRNIVYPGAIPLDTDLLTPQRNIMIALGALAQATLGTTTVADGLACTPQTVPNLTFSVGPGSIISLQTVDGNTFGSLPADNNDPLVKMGVNITSTLFTVTAPTTSGQSINYLVQAQFQESDTTPVVLPYYNAANPAVAFSGPSNSGASQNTQRIQRVNLQLKAGTPNSTGSQVTPNPDAGFVGLWAVTVAFAATTVVAGNITVFPTAPFVGTKLPQLRTKLTSNLTLYVNGTTGSDVNNGFAPSTALLTLQGAWTRILTSLDLSGFSVTVNVANGNYAPVLCGGVPVGAGSASVSFVGNTTTPDNCVVTASNAPCFQAAAGAQINVSGFKVTASGSLGAGVAATTAGSFVNVVGNMDLSSCGLADVYAAVGAGVVVSGNYTSSGASGSAWLAQGGGNIQITSTTITLSGTPSYSNAFAQAVGSGQIVCTSNPTFIGGATGARFSATAGGFVNTNTSNVTFLPGNAAGNSTTGYYN